MLKFNPEALSPNAGVLYDDLLRDLKSTDRLKFLSLLELVFYQGATAGAEEMHKQAKEIFAAG